jgi:hypothetical protein
MYLTGHGGYLFTKLLINGFFKGQTGVMGSDMLSDSQVDQYFAYAAELGITLDAYIKKPWEVMT